MKRNYNRPWLLLLIGIALACGSQLGRAQTNYPIFVDTNQFQYWWVAWGAPATNTFDPLQDAGGNTNSGSVRVNVSLYNTNGNDCSIGFSNPGGAWNAAFIGSLSNYMGVAFDILWGTNSAPDGDTNWATLNLRTANTGWTVEDGVNFTIVTNITGWQHCVRIWPPTYSATSVGAFLFYLWEGNGSGGGSINGPVTYWIDNITLLARTNPPPPPPTMAILRFSGPQGLRIFASYPGNGGQQQHLRTLQNTYTWIGQSQPVTYALTITNYPGTNHAGFQSDIFLVPDDIGNESAPFWNETNVAWVQIVNNSNGTATATFLYKTNSPNSIGDYYGSGTLGSITNPTPLGTWSLTFNNDTNITLTTPNGASTSFIMPVESLAFFQGVPGQMYVSIGMSPGNTNNLSETATYSRFQITGTTPVLDDTFVPPLDTFGTWVITADSPGGIVPIPSDPAWWLTWTLPDAAFTTQVSTNLGTNSWYDPGLTTVFQDQLRRRALVQWSNLQSSNAMNNYFRLAQTNSP